MAVLAQARNAVLSVALIVLEVDYRLAAAGRFRYAPVGLYG
ncbi:hypothetical protein LCGC14_1985140, partial [marine sediment metagenome]